MGYASVLAWVGYNQNLVFHHGDIIITTPSFFATPGDSRIHHSTYYNIHGCNAKT
jgi:hypothetical protein